MRLRRFFASVIAAGTFTAIVAPGANAQYTNRPFFTDPIVLSQAIGIELAQLRFRLILALDREFDTTIEEAIEALVGADYQRFANALGEIDEEFAGELYRVFAGALEVVGEGAVETGIDNRAVSSVALALLDDVYNLVIPAETQNDPVFKAAIMAQLLLGDAGVAEGLEEAFQELWQYSNGWIATQRVKELWADIAYLATEEQAAEIEDAFAVLDEVYPSPHPPETFAGIDPEEAETPAQRILGFLEAIVDAELYAGRDQLVLLDHMIGLTEQACPYFEQGEWPDWQAPYGPWNPPPPPTEIGGSIGPRLVHLGPSDKGRELIYPVIDHYGETTGLGDIIGLFAPEIHRSIMIALWHVANIEREIVINPATGDTLLLPIEFADLPNLPMSPADACHQALEGFLEARTIFGG